MGTMREMERRPELADAAGDEIRVVIQLAERVERRQLGGGLVQQVPERAHVGRIVADAEKAGK